MFETLARLDADPILGLMAAFRADRNPHKIDLGVGVYKDSAGNTPIMAAVKQAESRLLANQDTKSYVGPAGDARYNELVAQLLLGERLSTTLQERRCTFQVPGGCGGLRLAAEFVNKARPDARIWVSDPTWPNHVPLLGAAGLTIECYPYYDYQQHEIRFDEMLRALATASDKDLLLLHGCCHNPCGADLSRDQWQSVRDLALEKGLTVMIDVAYQGLGDGLEDDMYGTRLLADALPELMVVSSCSKNFGLYRERVGALTVICQSDSQRQVAASQLAAITRGIYSMPPDHGAAIVREILDDAGLRADWDVELAAMRDRINGLRALLADRLLQAGANADFRFIEREKGMFSFLGISVDQVKLLVERYSIYLVNSGRINIAGINEDNIDYLVDSLVAVL